MKPTYSSYKPTERRLDGPTASNRLPVSMVDSFLASNPSDPNHRTPQRLSQTYSETGGRSTSGSVQNLGPVPCGDRSLGLMVINGD